MIEESEELGVQSRLRNRTKVAVLVVCRSGNMSNQIRAALKTIGFTKLTAVPTHAAGIERMRGRAFTLTIFDAACTDMPTVDFVKQAMELEKDPILIASSGDPRIDDVFSILQAGARGFLAMPFTANSIEAVIEQAQYGPPLSDSVLQASDRNGALSSVILNYLYRVSVVMRQARDFSSAAREVDRTRHSFTEAVDLARLFCEGGDEDKLRDRILEDCLARASAAASRLGRTRQKLKKERAVTD